MEITTKTNMNSAKDNTNQIHLSQEELNTLHTFNLKALTNIEKQAQIHDIRQEQRDCQLEESDLAITQDLSLIKQELISLNENLEQLKITFLLIVKNFRNTVKKQELNAMEKKIESIQFEFLATDQEFYSGLENIKVNKAISNFIKQKI